MISVIVPCYNYAHFLGETLRSVQTQSYPDWECIIVNDGSTDNTDDVANQFLQVDKRFRYIKKENGGLSSSRNLGMSLAHGEFIQFLDADDTIHPEKFEKQIQVFDNLPNLDVCYSDFMYFNDKREYSPSIFNRSDLHDSPFLDFVMNWGFEFVIPIHCALFKHSIIKENNILFDISLKAREDWLFWITLSQLPSNFYFLNESLALYRKHDSSMVHNPVFIIQNTFKACLKVYGMLPNNEYKEEFGRKYSEYLTKDLQKINEKYSRMNNSFTIKSLRKLKEIINFNK